MESILQNMDPQKKDSMINAAIKEFSLYPYEKASTNNIVTQAGISKGLLFHYFGSKKELYEWLTGFVLHKLFHEISAQINWKQRDIFQRIKEIVIVKIRLGQSYPNMFDFVIKVLSDAQTKSIGDVQKLYVKYGIDIQTLLGDVYTKNIDFSLFSNQQAADKYINIIRWTLEKYSEENLLMLGNLQNPDYEQISADLDVYISILKNTFYS